LQPSAMRYSETVDPESDVFEPDFAPVEFDDEAFREAVAEMEPFEDGPYDDDDRTKNSFQIELLSRAEAEDAAAEGEQCVVDVVWAFVADHAPAMGRGATSPSLGDAALDQLVRDLGTCRGPTRRFSGSRPGARAGR